jgi:hypothetical protein
MKTPWTDSASLTEVILPEQDNQKNLVYVLLKKGEATRNVGIRRTSAPRQQKPKVYFIRYGNHQAGRRQQQYSNSDFNSQLEKRRRLERFMDLDDTGRRGRTSGRIHRHQKLILLRAVGVQRHLYSHNTIHHHHPSKTSASLWLLLL